jgi:histidinol-phosphatase (PHP family)
MLVDLHVHALAHGEYEANQAWLNAFIDKACRMGIVEMGFSEHDEFMAGFNLDIFQKVKVERQKDISLRLGLEIDYLPGIENDLKQKISRKDYDYWVGSVHYIDGWAFDHPDFRQGFEKRDIDDIYIRYAQILLQMVSSQLFDIVGHIDLVKIWGHRPQRRKTVEYFSAVLQEIKRTGMVVEINSAGLRKPVGEIYPSDDLLAQLYAMNIPITLGSDAHHPQQMGEGLDEALAAAKRAGYRTITGFAEHRPINRSV